MEKLLDPRFGGSILIACALAYLVKFIEVKAINPKCKVIPFPVRKKDNAS